MLDLDELERLTRWATPGEWQRGIAGNDTVVSFDGDDIVGVADPTARNAAYMIALQPRRVLELIARLRAAERALETCEDHIKATEPACICKGRIDAWRAAKEAK